VRTFVYGLGDSPYTFVSTPRLVADVQAWVDDQRTWVMLILAIGRNHHRARFASREPSREPYLVIEYAPPPR
jgi:hypothetical protein